MRAIVAGASRDVVGLGVGGSPRRGRRRSRRESSATRRRSWLAAWRPSAVRRACQLVVERFGIHVDVGPLRRRAARGGVVGEADAVAAVDGDLRAIGRLVTALGDVNWRAAACALRWLDCRREL